MCGGVAVGCAWRRSTPSCEKRSRADRRPAGSYCGRALVSSDMAFGVRSKGKIDPATRAPKRHQPERTGRRRETERCRLAVRPNPGQEQVKNISRGSADRPELTATRNLCRLGSQPRGFGFLSGFGFRPDLASCPDPASCPNHPHNHRHRGRTCIRRPRYGRLFVREPKLASLHRSVPTGIRDLPLIFLSTANARNSKSFFNLSLSASAIEGSSPIKTAKSPRSAMGINNDTISSPEQPPRVPGLVGTPVVTGPGSCATNHDAKGGISIPGCNAGGALQVVRIRDFRAASAPAACAVSR